MRAPVVIVWRFRVRAEHERDFRELYGPGGAWAALFRVDAAYQGTELLADADARGVYVTLDRWASLAAYEAFRAANAEAYAALDRRCDRFTDDETRIGVFGVVDER